MMQERSHKYLPPPSLEELGLQATSAPGERLSGAALPKMKKFRFQLLADYIADNFEPCSVADVAGGKGLLSYMLNKRGFESSVIDPLAQELPVKYKDLSTGKRVLIPETDSVPRIDLPFKMEMAKDFDLLVALHAHGVNLLILDAVAGFGCKAVIMPCCVIDEPEVPGIGENWFSWLVGRAEDRGLKVDYFYLNFRGQNVGFVASRLE